mmetsp:Transcript_39147/g.87898  ORF Transcript_39147/g.87898 Transcript_39147/m.87898 type:complete len:200 (-) Transcript_39147:466-1065(-)
MLVEEKTSPGTSESLLAGRMKYPPGLAKRWFPAVCPRSTTATGRTILHVRSQLGPSAILHRDPHLQRLLGHEASSGIILPIQLVWTAVVVSDETQLHARCLMGVRTVEMRRPARKENQLSLLRLLHVRLTVRGIDAARILKIESRSALGLANKEGPRTIPAGVNMRTRCHSFGEYLSPDKDSKFRGSAVLVHPLDVGPS